MPIIENNPIGFTDFGAPQDTPDTPGFFDSLEPAFETNSELLAAVDLLNAPTFDRDPTFDLGKRLSESQWATSHPRAFVGVESEAEFLHVEGKLRQGLQARDDLDAAGWSGFFAEIATEFTNPTNYLPIFGQAVRAGRGVRAVAEGAADAGVGVALQEAILRADQPERSLTESAMNLGSALVLGGALGGATSAFLGRAGAELSPEQIAEIARRLEADMGDSPGEFNITYSDGPSTLGAAQVRTYESAGALAPGRIGGREFSLATAGRLSSPVARLAESRFFPEFQWAGPNLETAGLYYARNREGVPTTPGGSVAARIKVLTSNALRETGIIEGNYAKFIVGSDGFVSRQAARIQGALGRGDRAIPTLHEYRREIGRAMHTGDQSDMPGVQDTIAHIRSTIIDPLTERQLELGIITEQDIIESLRKGSESYLHRMYRTDVISRRPSEFLAKLTRNAERQLEAEFQSRRESLLDRQQADEEVIRDLAVSDEELRKELIKELEEARRKAQQADPEALAALEDASTLRSLARGTEGDDARALRRRAREVEAEGGEGVQRLRATNAQINRRLAALRQSYASVEGRRARKLASIEGEEDRIFNAYRRLVRLGQKAQRDLAKVSDRELNAQLKSLSSALQDAMRVFNAGEERMVRLADGSDPALEGVLQTLDGAPMQREVRLTPAQKKALRIRLEPSGKANTFLIKTNAQHRRLLERIEEVAEANPRLRKGLQSVRERVGDQPLSMLERSEVERQKMARLQTLQQKRMSRVEAKIQRLEEAQGLDREAKRRAIEDAMEEGLQTIARQQDVRQVRLAKQRESLSRLDPERVTARINELKAKGAARTARFLEDFGRTADDFDLEGGSASFKEEATERATQVMQRILGNDRVAPGLQMAGDPDPARRGPELARTLDIPFDELEEFIETDVEKVIRSYSRTVSSDVALTERLGDPNGHQVLTDVQDRYKRLVAQIQADEALDDAAKNESIATITREMEGLTEDFNAIVARHRHLRGIPENPNGFGFRMGQALMNLNVLRLMGTVIPSSVADLARPVLKHGLKNVMREGFLPLVGGLKALKMRGREVQLAGTALDIVASTRAQLFSDVLDDVGQRSLPERALTYASNQMGKVALFDYWNSGAKQFTGAITIGRMMRALDELVEGQASQADITWLASLGIDEFRARKILAQMDRPGGSNTYNGIRYPNTEAWTDREAIESFRAAIVEDVDNTIITPGAERPIWIDQNQATRLLNQFRSFGYSSTTKATLAGLQQGDVAVLNGAMSSLALGALSYYIWAVTSGGRSEEAMRNAPLEKWMDEAIDRSGLLGILSEPRDFLSRIPGTSEFVTFSDAPLTRRAGQDLISMLAGPSYGTLTEVGNVLMGIDEPTQSTLRDVRQLTPYQNVFWLRRILDQVEESTAEGLGLPEQREPN